MENAVKLLRWKEKVISGWESLEVAGVERFSSEDGFCILGEKFTQTVDMKLGILNPDDIKIEVLGVKNLQNGHRDFRKQKLDFIEMRDGNARYACTIEPQDAGVWDYAIRVIPSNNLLPHDMDFNLVKWI